MQSDKEKISDEKSTEVVVVQKKEKKFQIEDFEFIGDLGTGSFGIVKLAKCKIDG